ncbi:MAG TPA: AAA family ATPase [Thermoguttaceae bacterium]|nr:AAA family ATPase [Thermoguttaceae bacterium]
MRDQANHLRQLVRDCATQLPTAKSRPSLAVVSSGKGGVGTTTVAVNLAVEMAQKGLRTTLVDADPNAGDVAALCRLEDRYTVADVLSGRRTVREVIQPGPAAIDVLPGVWGLERLSDFPDSAVERLLQGLFGLGEKTDLIVLDAGNTPNRLMRRLWRAADLNLIVATPETLAILDTYAIIKVLCSDEKLDTLYTLVNRAESASDADSVHSRLAQACHRFLGVTLHRAGHLPPDLAIDAAGRASEPFVIAMPNCDARQDLDRLVATLRELLASDQRHGTSPNSEQHDSTPHHSVEYKPNRPLQRPRITA